MAHGYAVGGWSVTIPEKATEPEIGKELPRRVHDGAQAARPKFAGTNTFEMLLDEGQGAGTEASAEAAAELEKVNRVCLRKLEALKHAYDPANPASTQYLRNELHVAASGQFDKSLHTVLLGLGFRPEKLKQFV